MTRSYWARPRRPPGPAQSWSATRGQCPAPSPGRGCHGSRGAPRRACVAGAQPPRCYRRRDRRARRCAHRTPAAVAREIANSSPGLPGPSVTSRAEERVITVELQGEAPPLIGEVAHPGKRLVAAIARERLTHVKRRHPNVIALWRCARSATAPLPTAIRAPSPPPSRRRHR